MVHSHQFFTTKLSDINKVFAVKVLMKRVFQADRAEWRPILNQTLMCNFRVDNETARDCVIKSKTKKTQSPLPSTAEQFCSSIHFLILLRVPPVLTFGQDPRVPSVDISATNKRRFALNRSKLLFLMQQWPAEELLSNKKVFSFLWARSDGTNCCQVALTSPLSHLAVETCGAVSEVGGRGDAW